MAGMLSGLSERGATLVEALVAGALLATLAAGSGSLLLLAHQLAVRAERLMMAATLATARLQALRAVPFEYDASGAPVDLPALSPTAADALDRNVNGCWDALDETGRPVGTPQAGAPAYIRRWAVEPIDTIDGRAIGVCVYPWPALPGTGPLACVATVRSRQP